MRKSFLLSILFLFGLSANAFAQLRPTGGGGGSSVPAVGWRTPVDTTTALQAISSTAPTDKDVIFVQATGQLYAWNATALTGDYAPSDKVTRTTTFTVAGSLVNSTAHGWLAGQSISFTTTGSLPTGLSLNTPYFVINPTANTFQISATSGGAAIAFTTTGTPTTTAIMSGYWIQIASDLAIGASLANGATARVAVINPVSSTGGIVTIQPPVNPFIGARFGVKDVGGAAATNNIKIDFAVQKYEGLSGSPTAEYWMNSNNAYVEFIYHSVARGWVKKGTDQ